MKYIFGPVPSRRLGISLGVDIIPAKTCSLNCVYCECGLTTNLSLERKSFFPYKEIINELETFLNNNPRPDYITFSGSGEPTLNSDIGEIALYIKGKGIPSVLLTNGTLLYRDDVFEDIKSIDLIIPSLDAGDEETFKKINHPHKALKFNKYIEGLKRLNSLKKRVWLEIFIVKGINDSKTLLSRIKNITSTLNVEKIQLNTVDRPPALKGCTGVSIKVLEDIKHWWDDKRVEVIYPYKKRKDYKAFKEHIADFILETLKRRPMTVNDISNITGLHTEELFKYIEILKAEGTITPYIKDRGIFYKKRRGHELY